MCWLLVGQTKILESVSLLFDFLISLIIVTTLNKISIFFVIRAY